MHAGVGTKTLPLMSSCLAADRSRLGAPEPESHCFCEERVRERGSRCRSSQKVQAVTGLPVNGQVSSNFREERGGVL